MIEKLIDWCYFRVVLLIPIRLIYWPWRNGKGQLSMTPLGRFYAAAWGYFEAKDAGIIVGLPWSYRNIETQ